MRVIQLASGCAMSSAVRATVIEALAAQEFHFNKGEGSWRRIDAGIKAEFTTPQKNKLFENGMTPKQLFLKTIESYDYFIGKIPLQILQDDKDRQEIIDMIPIFRFVFFHSFRSNPIDIALCFLRDFSSHSREYRKEIFADEENNKGMPFVKWRKSHQRIDYKIVGNLDKIITKIKGENSKLASDAEIARHVPNIVSVDARKFLSYQWSDDLMAREYSLEIIKNLMDRMELQFNYEVVSAYFSSRQGTRTPPRSHSELQFEEFSNQEFKEAISANGLGEFWR